MTAPPRLLLVVDEFVRLDKVVAVAEGAVIDLFPLTGNWLFIRRLRRILQSKCVEVRVHARPGLGGERLGAGDPAEEVLDDSFVAAYAVAGTVEQCLDQCRDLAATGVTQMTLTFHGEDPDASMARFGDAARDP